MVISTSVADKDADAERIETMKVGQRYIVGIDREAKLLGTTNDKYLERIVGSLRTSALSDPLKTQVLSQ